MENYKVGDVIGLYSDIKGKIPDGSAPVYIVSKVSKSTHNCFVIQVFPVNEKLMNDELTIEEVEFPVGEKDMIKLYEAGSEESFITIGFYLPNSFYKYFTNANKNDELAKLIDDLNEIGIDEDDMDVSTDDEVHFYIDGKEIMSASMSSIEYSSEKSNNKKTTSSSKNKKEDIIKYSNLKTIDECLDALNDLDILYKMFEGKVYLNKKEKVLERLKMLVEKENVVKGV